MNTGVTWALGKFLQSGFVYIGPYILGSAFHLFILGGNDCIVMGMD